jgi:hypothetical protein
LISLAGFHDPVGGAEDPLRALLGQRGALQPTLDVEPALGLAGQIQQRAQQVGDAFDLGDSAGYADTGNVRTLMALGCRCVKLAFVA